MKGLFIGRFQPFHLGHLSVVERMVEECETIIIGVGSAEKMREENNPLSGGERIEMIKRVLDGQGYESYEIYPIPDLNCYPKWPYYVKTILPNFDIVYGNSGIVTGLFKEIGIEIRHIQMINRDDWKGREVRRMMKEDTKWKDLVPPEVVEFMKDIKIEERLGPMIEMKSDTERELAHLLTKKGMTISTAESCTGGMIANRLTDVPGSSAYFERGVMTYSNRSKIDLLGVDETVIKDKGAVSPEVVMSMAKGIRKDAKTDIGLAVTGIAGPSGGSEHKPVGTVYIGMSIEMDTRYKHLQLSGNREEIKEQVSEEALRWLIFLLKEQTNSP